MKVCVVTIGLIFVTSTLRAVSLPTNMSVAEVNDTVKTIGTAATTRLLRDAESYPTWPGVKFGLEILAFPTKEIATYGAGNGSLSSMMVLPRFYLSKGIVYGLDLTLSALPAGIINSLSTYGGILKWTFYSERENQRGSVAAYLGLTKLSGLSGYSGTDWEGGLIASRDLVRIKPFLSMGLIFASGSVATSVDPTHTSRNLAIHTVLGLEWELLANITAQAELINLSPAVSISINKKY